jgi:hypothetical protein
MEDRIRRLENFAQLATTLAVEMEAAQRRMEAAQLRMEESQRRMEESQRQMEESQRMRDELLEQMLQAVAVIQAEIVRIDETHS